MTFKDVINNNIKNINGVPKWWMQYAFHMTDVSNVVEILSSSLLFSRKEAVDKELMKNDNASEEVIDRTLSSVKSFVRFYFRPLTPTQYYNEGFKHPDIQMNNANVPVPIFLLFDLADLLSTEGVYFSETTMAGYGGDFLSSERDFEQMDFEKIYSIGPFSSSDEKKYRQAEILCNSGLEIDKTLRAIVCRNNVERQTLISLLNMRSRELVFKYGNKIAVQQDGLYYSNGLYIKECSYYDNMLYVEYSNDPAKLKYIQSKSGLIGNSLYLNELIKIDWYKNDSIIDSDRFSLKIDYIRTQNHRIILPEKAADYIIVEIFYENSLMCRMKFQIEEEIL